MIFRKSTFETNDDTKKCTECNTPDSIASDAQTESCETGYFKELLTKFKIRSIFEDSEPRTMIEKQLSNKYFAFMITVLISLIFWISKIFSFEIAFFEDTEIIKISASLPDILSIYPLLQLM